ncbi:sugar ABC transporter substrate-binding protein [soil metagenome]
MTRPRFSTVFAVTLALLAVVLLAAAVALGYTSEPRGKTVLTVRLWDPQVATAYRQSLDEFTRRHPDIEVRVNVVAYSSYFDTLRTDVASGGADDIFWISNAYLSGYADNGRLMPIEKSDAWEPSVVRQFTRDDVLWGVPQLTDAGIAVYYNADLLAAAGVAPDVLDEVRWSPDAAKDTLRPLLAKLTSTSGGRTQWGYNAANDLQGIYLNYVGSAGGMFQQGDRFAFDNPQAATAFRYLVSLINDDRVSPPAADTNNNGDFSRNQFLAGHMAMFQSGTYNLAAIAEQATFGWGVAMLPAGPTGRVSVTNGIAAAGNSATKHPDAVRQVLAWLGSTEGNAYVGTSGAAIPAVLAAQQVYFDYWSARGVDVSPFFRVLDGLQIPAPGGSGFAAGYQAITPYFDEMFLGREPVEAALAQAQAAANAAAAP